MPPAPGWTLSTTVLLYAGVSAGVELTPAWDDEQVYGLTAPSLLQFAHCGTRRRSYLECPGQAEAIVTHGCMALDGSDAREEMRAGAAPVERQRCAGRVRGWRRAVREWLHGWPHRVAS